MFDVLNLYLHHHVSAEIILVQQFKKNKKKQNMSSSRAHTPESVIEFIPHYISIASLNLRRTWYFLEGYKSAINYSLWWFSLLPLPCHRPTRYD